MIINLDSFYKENKCTYNGEVYSVRNNGAVLRHPKNESVPRITDNKWTFGKSNTKTGYMEIAGERVHRIVATAFHGEAPTSQHVVDHIDTNRRNNRSENLRWITKLENILLNPITAKKIEFICGSVEEFLKDPSKLRQGSVDKNYGWMRAVSKREAKICLERMQEWAKTDKAPTGKGSLGEWIFQRGYKKTFSDKDVLEIKQNLPEAEPRKEREKAFDFKSLTGKDKEKLLTICEPIIGSGQGVLHSYVACPLYQNSIDYFECVYCEYHISQDEKVDDGICFESHCFGKSEVKTYEDLMSVVGVEKKDEMVVGITFMKDGKTVRKKFNKEAKLPGKTIFDLWDKRKEEKVVARNIYSNWFVLIEEDPKLSIEKNGGIFAKVGRTVEELSTAQPRSIFSYDSHCWEAVK